jgi:hypothetical protein
MEWEELFARMGLIGRVFDVRCHGDTAPEIEMAALEEAEHAFGPGVALAVVPCYRMFWLSLDELEITGKRYGAYITVLARSPSEVI